MAVDILLKIDGVDGESVIKDHEGEIDILSWSWGMSQTGSMHTGGGGGAGKVNVNDISLFKNADKSSPNLMRACCNGDHFKEAVLVVRKAGKTALEYYRVTMTAVMVTSVSVDVSAGSDTLSEHVTLNFAKVQVDYAPQKEDGSGDAEITMNWNIEKNIEE